MPVDDLIRLAWRAQNEGLGRLRETMLTLALVEGRDAPWAERCRARLVAERPGHFLGAHPSLDQTLRDPRVESLVAKLSAQFPPARVGWLSLRLGTASGPYAGDGPPLGTLLDALIGPPAEAEVRRDTPAVSVRGPVARVRAGVPVGAVAGSITPRTVSGDSVEFERDEDATPATEADDDAFYLAVLFSIALLLAGRSRTDRASAA